MLNRVSGVLLIALAACVGCDREEPAVLGQFHPSSDVIPVSAVDALEARRPVTVEGTVAEVCPTVGCWLRLEEGESRLHVELAGFIVGWERIGDACRAQGRLTEKDGRLTLIANGVSFER